MSDFEKIWSIKALPPRKLVGRALFALAILCVLTIGGVCSWSAMELVDRPFPGFFMNQRMVIGAIGQVHWSGSQAGLNSRDKILRANREDIRSPRDLEEVIRQAKVGDTIRYTVDRKGRAIEVDVAVMRFTAIDLVSTYGILFLFGVFYLTIGVVVFALKPDTEITCVFFSACTLLSVSSIISYDVEVTHLGFIRAYLLNEALLPAIVLHLSCVFPTRFQFFERRSYLKWTPYVVSAIFLVLLEMLYPNPSFLPVYRLALLYMFVGALAFVGATFYSFFTQRSALARERAKVVMIGAALGLPVPAFSPLLASAGITLGGIRVLSNISSIPVLIFPVLIGYAIAKHNLFDVDVYIKRAVGYAMMTAIVGAGYFGLQVGLESIFLTPMFGKATHTVTAVLFALLVVFLFNPMNRWVQDAVDRMFYRKKFDYKATVTAVSDALSSVLNLDEIVRKIVGTVHSEMFIDRSGLVLAGAQGGGFPGYFLDDAPSDAAEEIRRASLPEDDPIVKLVRERKKLVTKYDVAEDPHFAQVKDVCGRRFEELGASLAVPLLYRGEVKAVLAVGHKKSGHFFTREDIDLLQTLASHGAVAIENANLAEQMKKDETVRTNLSRYLSPQIVDRIVKHDVQVNLGGDRKVVTILFSDIRDFTTITETRPPDQLVTILNEYFTEMARIIFDHQGSLDKYIGDAIVAVFGSLVPVENPAGNAVAASVAMMKRLPELNRRWEARYGFSMNIGIGVNTGEVFLGNIGSPERMEFTVIGDAVNVASRFSGLAKAGQVLVTRETRVLLGPDVRIDEHPLAEVKGKTGKLEVFEVLYT